MKAFALFNTGLVVQEFPGARWDPAMSSEEDEAIDILNGYKEVPHKVRHFRRLETLPQPSGKHISTLVPIVGVIVLGLALLANGMPWYLALPLTFSAAFMLGKLEADGDLAPTD